MVRPIDKTRFWRRVFSGLLTSKNRNWIYLVFLRKDRVTENDETPEEYKCFFPWKGIQIVPEGWNISCRIIVKWYKVRGEYQTGITQYKYRWGGRLKTTTNFETVCEEVLCDIDNAKILILSNFSVIETMKARIEGIIE